MAHIPFKIEYRIIIESFYSLFEAVYKKGFFFAGETHNFWECLYVLDGEVCVSADERIYNLKKHEIIFHKPMELHKFNIESTDAKLLIFSFTLSGPLCSYFENKVFSLSENQILILSSMLSYMHCQAKKQPKFDKLSNPAEYLKMFRYEKNFSQTVLAYIYQLFLSLSYNESVPSASSDPNASIFSEAVGYMNGNISEQLRISEIAKYCRISESGLKRLFSRYAGVSVHKYFLKLKIKAAADMLNSGENVTTVSEKLAFSSQGYFTKVFKRETGFLPSQFRDEKKEQLI